MSTAGVANPGGELRDVRGPYSFGDDSHRFWTLVWLLARSDFKLRYAGSFLGPLWGLLRPIAIFGVLYVVFTYIVRFGEEIEFYAPLLLYNIMLFTFFADATTTALACLVRNQRIVSKTQFPRAVLPLASVLTHGFNLGFNFAVVISFFIFAGVPIRLTWLLIPLVVLILAILTVCVSALLSVLYAEFRDVEQLWTGVISRVLFYASPILYPIEFVPENLRDIAMLNPLAPLLVESRKWLIDPDAPGLESVSPVVGLVSLVVFATVCFISVAVFVRRAPRVAEAL
jgi:ABC-2 type transport system permease protein